MLEDEKEHCAFTTTYSPLKISLRIINSDAFSPTATS
jgi:hypothetical protein